MGAEVRLPHGWNVTFVDGAKLAMLRKPGASRTRELCYQFSNNRIRRIDPRTKLIQTDPFNRIPEDARLELLAACRERWPGDSVTPKGGRS